MSRTPRAGVAGKPLTIRATDDERAEWARVAKLYGDSLSDFARRAMGLMAARHPVSTPSPPDRSSSSKRTRSRR